MPPEVFGGPGVYPTVAPAAWLVAVHQLQEHDLSRSFSADTLTVVKVEPAVLQYCRSDTERKEGGREI